MDPKILSCVVVLGILCLATNEVQSSGMAENRILTEILGPDYDRNIRPYSNLTGSGPTEVHVNMYVRSINSVDDIKMEFSPQLSFRMRWMDKRLAYSATKGSDKLKYVTLTDSTQIWLPDLFFSNEKVGHKHDMLKPNVLIRISPDGEVLYSVRVSLTLSCPMMLKLYPFDKQTCTIRMASYAYTSDDIIFKWKEENPVQITPDLHLPSFALEEYSTNYCDSHTITGYYSCIRLDLLMKRQVNRFFLDVYIPCAMLVILAWLSLWLEHHGPGAMGRLLMGVVTLLVMAVSVQLINSKSPQVSYTKALDVYTGICLTFVFSTIVEFVIANYLARNRICCSSNETQIKSQRNILDEIRDWRHNCPDVLDVIMRIVYPIAFLLFVSIYFTTYCIKRSVY